MSEGVWPTLLHGDCRAVLQTLEAESVHMVCTSPPYFGLRRYLPEGHPDEVLEIGSEDSPEAWVENLVAVFREVKRVLRSDGTLFVNCGDAYAATPGKGGNVPQTKHPKNEYPAHAAHRSRSLPGIKPKDLIGLPWMLAFALRADGWYLRSDIIWAKPNPMPESVTDRPTRSHEYLFMFAKSERYYMDMDALREPHAAESQARVERKRSNDHKWKDGGPGHQTIGNDLSQALHPNGRNKRTVWNIPTQAVSFAHFACFPEALVEPCILTSPTACCPECGAGWRRVVEKTGQQGQKTWSGAGRGNGCPAGGGHQGRTGQWSSEVTSTGWEPTCSHVYPEAELIPATCLDPFVGSGTTCRVAMRLGRRSIGIDLSSTYLADIAARRTEQGALGI